MRKQPLSVLQLSYWGLLGVHPASFSPMDILGTMRSVRLYCREGREVLLQPDLAARYLFAFDSTQGFMCHMINETEYCGQVWNVLSLKHKAGY